MMPGLLPQPDGFEGVLARAWLPADLVGDDAARDYSLPSAVACAHDPQRSRPEEGVPVAHISDVAAVWRPDGEVRVPRCGQASWRAVTAGVCAPDKDVAFEPASPKRPALEDDAVPEGRPVRHPVAPAASYQAQIQPPSVDGADMTCITVSIESGAAERDRKPPARRAPRWLLHLRKTPKRTAVPGAIPDVTLTSSPLDALDVRAAQVLIEGQELARGRRRPDTRGYRRGQRSSRGSAGAGCHPRA